MSSIEEKLKEKYGDKWMLVPLTEEELAQIPTPSKEEIKKALDEMYRIANLPIYPHSFSNPGIRYR